MSGLIKRVVWIWPIWDKKNHNSSYAVVRNQIGIATLRRKDSGVPYQVFCLCELTQKSKCEYLDLESENVSMIQIPKSKCRIKKSFIFEEVREDIAAKLMRDSKWLVHEDDIILDIDEDYYGCVYASQPLIDAGLHEAELNQMNLYLSKLVCPKSFAQEKFADNVFVTALEIYRQYYNCKNPNSLSPNKRKCPTLEKTSLEVTSYLQNILWQNKKIRLCSKHHHAVKYAISEIVHSFQKLTVKQIKPLQRVGFCLNTSPKTFKITMPSFFRICLGANTPSDSAVLIHNPTKKEITERTATLQNILNAIKMKSVKMVTICRSSRDGYTPRRYVNLIESDIMKSLNKTFSSNCVAHYDGGLLGGIKGWLSRPRNFDKKLWS